MKKIGTITFHRSLNYGSVLQTFALQQVIKKMYAGCITEVIDFYPPEIEKIRSIFIPVHSLKNMLHNMLALAYYPMFKRRKTAFDSFLDNNVQITEKKYKADSDMAELGSEYDCLIAGSDQIWNNKTTDFSIQYFFPSIQTGRKIAYAPSLGNGIFKLPEDQQIYDALNGFDAISVREISGAKRIEEFIGKKVPVVLDPTLLLLSEDFETVETEERGKRRKYIFVYSVNMNRKTLEIAKAISRKVNLPIITIYTTNGSFRAVSKGIKLNKDAAPGDFLRLIHHAELVISDSFHGTAFSINYHKKFYCVCEKNPNRRDPRLETLLSALDLKSRMLFFNKYDQRNYMEEINYSIADKKLKQLRGESLDFLKNALYGGNYDEIV